MINPPKQIYMQANTLPGLSPVQFLRGFNDMTDNFNYTESILKEVRKKNGSKLTDLKKFPIPSYYNSMEGLDMNQKEKVSVQKTRNNLFNLKDEKFRKNHNSLIKKIINKMIENNVNHMKILNKNRQFYKNQSPSSTVQRTLSLNMLEKPKKPTRQKEPQIEVKQFPPMNFKTLSKDREKKAYIIDFNPEMKGNKRSSSTMKLRDLDGITRIIKKRKSANLMDEMETERTDTHRKQSIVSLSNDLPAIRRTQDLNESNKHSDNTKMSERQFQQVNILLNPQMYIKRKFKNPLSINYEEDKRLRKVADNLTNEIVYHYTQDFETPNNIN